MDNQFVISYELLELFKWMLEHELDALKKIVSRSLTKGLAHKLSTTYSNEMYETSDEMQQYIVDFFAVLETLMHDVISEQEINRIIERNLMPAIDKIDVKACDSQLVASSVAKAASTCEDNPNKDFKAVLCKELLKRWKPAKSVIQN